MIRTSIVQLTTMTAIAYRQKINGNKSGIVIVRPDVAQPGIAAISRTSGEPILTANTAADKYPIEAFKEAMELTAGMPYKNSRGVKYEDYKPVEAEVENEEVLPEAVVIDSAEYQAVVTKYTDKNGKLSYDLLNKDMIHFLNGPSAVVQEMIKAGDPVETIRNYIVGLKFRDITGNHDLSDAQVLKMVEMIDEVSPKGVFKEFNAEIVKALKK